MGVPAQQIKHNPLFALANSKKYKLVNSFYVEQALSFINLLHVNNTGYFCFLTKKNNIGYSKFYKNIDFNTCMNFLSLQDIYVSINSFYIPVRNTTTVRQINAFFIDLDYYKIQKYKNKTPQEMLKIIENKCPIKPSFYVDSGRGMYVFWLIQDVPKQALKLWVKIENKLVEIFTPYGADKAAKDVARVLRLPGSINSKTERRASLITPYKEIERYTLKQMANVILKDKKENRKQIKIQYKNNTKTKVYRLLTLRNLHFCRLLDLEQLAKTRNYNLSGYRHNFLYIYAITHMYLNSDFDNAANCTINLNNKLTQPLVARDLKDTIKSAYTAYKRYLEVTKTYVEGTSLVKHLRENGCVIYSNNGIIERLEILETEMQNFKTLISPEVKTKRKKEVNKKYYIAQLEKQGKTTKQKQLVQLRQKIIDLKAKGLKNKEISIMLNIPQKTLERHITFIKKHGLSH